MYIYLCMYIYFGGGGGCAKMFVAEIQVQWILPQDVDALTA